LARLDGHPVPHPLAVAARVHRGEPLEVELLMAKAKGPERPKREAGIIDSFKGEYAFLSNFWPWVDGVMVMTEPVVLKGRVFPSAEHAYQACKTLSEEEQRRVAGALTPGKAKAIGRSLVLRPDWEQKKVGIMRLVIQAKFAPTTRLSHELMLTGDKRLVEGNTWDDDFWGCVQTTPGGVWIGRNELGRLLMEQRTALQHDIPFGPVAA
jgi:ribA/ribD-fused uncharacterized protein